MPIIFMAIAMTNPPMTGVMRLDATAFNASLWGIAIFSGTLTIFTMFAPLYWWIW